METTTIILILIVFILSTSYFLDCLIKKSYTKKQFCILFGLSCLEIAVILGIFFQAISG